MKQQPVTLRSPRWSRTTNTSAESAQLCCANSVASRADAGQHHFVADVLAENYAMRRVVNDAGWPTIERRDGSVVSVDVNLDDIDESSEVAAPQSAALVATDARKTPRTAAMTFGGDRGT